MSDTAPRCVRPTGPLLSIHGLEVELATPRGAARVLAGVDLEVDRGEAVGLVGESGCGKTLTALSVMRLLPTAGRITAGTVRFQGRDLANLSEHEVRAVRGHGIAMIFQAPRESLNPVLTIGQHLGLVLARHDGLRGPRARAEELCGMVELGDPARVLRAYPYELSGGMCQRAMIALALACRPVLLIAVVGSSA